MQWNLTCGSRFCFRFEQNFYKIISWSEKVLTMEKWSWFVKFSFQNKVITLTNHKRHTIQWTNQNLLLIPVAGGKREEKCCSPFTWGNELISQIEQIVNITNLHRLGFPIKIWRIPFTRISLGHLELGWVTVYMVLVKSKW